MKTKIVTAIILAGMHNLSFSEEPKFRITKDKLVHPEISATDNKKPDAEFRIQAVQPNQMIPDLVIPTYSTGRRRVVDLRASEERMEVAIQIDELGIGYFDYRLESGKWILKNTKSVCSLSGALALALAQVDIREGGVVEVKYHEGTSVRGKSSWDKELIMKDHNNNDKLLSERYTLREDGFRLAGEPVRLRPKVDVSKIHEEQNKAQHPTDGAPEPEKPKE